MRSTILTSIAAGLLLLAAKAPADEYTVVDGVLSDTTSDGSDPLAGSLLLELSETTLGEGAISMAHIRDFELRAGDRTFLPAVPIEYDGQRPIGLLRSVDHLQFDEHGAVYFYLRSGGELVEENGDHVTFRYLDFQWTSRAGAPAGGNTAADPLPRRFDVQGTLYQVDHTFEVLADSCPPIEAIPRPPTDGVIITAQDPNVFHSFEPLVVPAAELTTFVQQEGTPGVVSRVSGGTGSSIEGELRSEGSLVVANTAGLSFNAQMLQVTLTAAPPTLEELSIRAPDGAEIWVEGGVLFVRTEGDLYLEGPLPEIPGVTAYHFTADGNITVENFSVPPGHDLELWGSNTVDPPVFPGPIPGSCLRLEGLRAIFPPEKTAVGSFSLIASIANRAMEIDVLPRESPNRLKLGIRRPIRVALLGSEDLDVRDVDTHSLRLGPSEAAPKRFYGDRTAFLRDVNRDGHLDLLAFFKLHRLGLAYGDTDLCLFAETRDGDTLEGCDAIDTRPRRARSSWRSFISRLAQAAFDIDSRRR